MPPGTDKYVIYEKYYPYKNESIIESDYYTIDKNLYEEIIRLNKLYKLDTILACLLILWIIPLILFGAFNLWLCFTLSFAGCLLCAIAVGMFETNLNSKYFDLRQKFISTEEFAYQKEQEEIYNKIYHEQKVYDETRELVEMYNILDNKKMSKETKIKRLMKYIDKEV